MKITFKQAFDLLVKSSGVLLQDDGLVCERATWDKSDEAPIDLEDPEEQDWKQYKFSVCNDGEGIEHFFLDADNETVEVDGNSMTLFDKNISQVTFYPLFKNDLEDILRSN